jgi:hypothetical protein
VSPASSQIPLLPGREKEVRGMRVGGRVGMPTMMIKGIVQIEKLRRALWQS